MNTQLINAIKAGVRFGIGLSAGTVVIEVLDKFAPTNDEARSKMNKALVIVGKTLIGMAIVAIVADALVPYTKADNDEEAKSE